MGTKMKKRERVVFVLAGLTVMGMTISLAGCGGGGGGNGMVKPTGPSSPGTPPPTSSPPPSSAPSSSSPTTGYDPHNNQLIPTNVLPAQKAGFNGKGVKVGVVDSGVDPNNPALNASDASGRNKVVWFKSYLPHVTNPTSANDNLGHGTTASELIAGDAYTNKTNGVQFNGGVAPGSSLYVAQVCSGYGTSAGETCNPTAQAYSDLVGQGVKVIGEAFRTGGDVTTVGGASSPTAQTVHTLLQPVAQAGVLQVFATGDTAAQKNPDIDAALPYLFPDMKGYIVAVTGVDIDANGHPTGLYTEHAGATPCGVAAQWCISAPAEVFTVPAQPGFDTGHPIGTLSATAIVVGVTAQIWQAFPWMTAPNVTDTLLTTATPISGCDTDQCGWGMVDAARAVKGPAGFAFGDFDAKIPSGQSATFANDIGGSGGLTLSGPGTLQLTGSNTYSGDTVINAGTLKATGALPGNVTVNGAGKLDAVPEVKGDLANSGTVTVQGSNGSQTQVDGNYSQLGTLAVSLGSTLAVNGTATLNNGTLEVTGADKGYVASKQTDVLTAQGGITGKFGKLVLDQGVVFTDHTIHHSSDGKSVYLDTTGLKISAAAAAMGIVDPASVGAARRVQLGFDSINDTLASGGKPPASVLQGAGAIQHSGTPAVARTTLRSLSGQLHAASAAMLFDGIDARGNALSEHFDDLLAGRAQPGGWYSSLGWQGNLQRSGYTGATFRSSGGMIGADVRIGSHALLGIAAGQGTGFGQLDAAWDHNRTWMNDVAMYAGAVAGPWYASARVASGWYREDMRRLLQLGALAAPVGAGSDGRYLSGALEGGHLFYLAGTRVVPFAAVRYQRLDLGGFIEQGGLGYGLEADSHAVGRTQAGLGMRAVHRWQLFNGMRLVFHGSAGWHHTLQQYGAVFDASFTGFNQWLPVRGVGLSRNTETLRAGLSLWPTQDFGLRLGYLREQGGRQRAGSVMMQGAVTF
jgi:autotransporter-associated beta strand protein